MMLAMSLDELFAWLIAVGFVLVVLGFVSFIPARRGHWSALLLAAPSLLVGGIGTWGTLTSEGRALIPYLSLFFPVQLLMGVAAVMLWFICRRA